MKKLLYLIPLFIFIFLISPSNVFAAYNYHYTFVKSPLTDEQKQEYLEYVYTSEEFQSALVDYPYYAIVYQQERHYPVNNNPGWRYDNHIIVVMLQELPSFSSSDMAIDILFSKISNYKILGFKIDDSLSYVEPQNLVGFYLVKYSSYSGNTNYENIFLDYYLSTNLVYTHSKDINVYDTDGNLIKTIPSGENLFNDLDIRPEIPEEEIDPSINSILNSEDKLYSLSKQLLGELPEEFTFLYSLVQLFLGIVIILVVLSPIILLLRLFR